MDTDRIAGMSTNDEQARRGVHRRMLDPQLSPNFLNSKLEWRRLFAELWGTFLLVMVAAGGGVVRAVSDGQLSLAMIVVAPGMMVMAIIYFMGAVSGAHLNPAVTLAFAVRRNFPWRRVPGYCLAQLAGGIAAAVFLRSLFGSAGLLGATVPGPGISSFTAMVIEVVLTAGLVNTILGTASGARNIGTNGALAVGAYIALAGLWAAPISGASMNPVRSLGPDLIRWNFQTSWVYVVGPVLGALVGVVFEWLLRGKATSAGAIAAQGSLEFEDSMRTADPRPYAGPSRTRHTIDPANANARIHSSRDPD